MENNYNDDRPLEKAADDVIIGSRFRKKELLQVTEFSKIYAGTQSQLSLLNAV